MKWEAKAKMWTNKYGHTKDECEQALGDLHEWLIRCDGKNCLGYHVVDQKIEIAVWSRTLMEYWPF